MATGSNLLGKLKQFDAYPKTLEDFRVKTFGGAASMFSCALCRDVSLFSAIDSDSHSI